MPTHPKASQAARRRLKRDIFRAHEAGAIDLATTERLICVARLKHD
jgi:hypothetical protein